MDFSKFDQQVNLEQLKADAAEIEKNGGTGDYPEIGAGVYHGKIEKLEVGSTKDGRPMLKVQFRITEDPHKKSCLFMNRVLYGTKNDANIIIRVFLLFGSSKYSSSLSSSKKSLSSFIS